MSRISPQVSDLCNGVNCEPFTKEPSNLEAEEQEFGFS